MFIFFYSTFLHLKFLNKIAFDVNGSLEGNCQVGKPAHLVLEQSLQYVTKALTNKHECLQKKGGEQIFPILQFSVKCLFIAISLCIVAVSLFSLQTLARCLIMWDEIFPNADWVTSNVPQVR